MCFMRNFYEFLFFYSILLCNKYKSIMTKEKFIDITSTMIEFGMLDPYEAMLNQNYLVEMVNMYVKAANVARKMMNMEPIL